MGPMVQFNPLVPPDGAPFATSGSPKKNSLVKKLQLAVQKKQQA